MAAESSEEASSSELGAGEDDDEESDDGSEEDDDEEEDESEDDEDEEEVVFHQRWAPRRGRGRGRGADVIQPHRYDLEGGVRRWDGVNISGPPATLQDVQRARAYYQHTFQSWNAASGGAGAEDEGRDGRDVRNELDAAREWYLEVCHKEEQRKRWQEEQGAGAGGAGAGGSGSASAHTRQVRRHESMMEERKEVAIEMQGHATQLRQTCESEIAGTPVGRSRYDRHPNLRDVSVDVTIAKQALTFLQQSLGRLESSWGGMLAMDTGRAEPLITSIRQLLEAAITVQAGDSAFVQRRAPQRCAGGGETSDAGGGDLVRSKLAQAAPEPPLLMLPPELRVRAALWLQPDDLSSLDISCNAVGLDVAEAAQQQAAKMGSTGPTACAATRPWVTGPPPSGKSWAWLVKYGAYMCERLVLRVMDQTGETVLFKVTRLTKMVRTWKVTCVCPVLLR